MGYIKTHRIGDTGIGKTLEDLLGISENNIAGPDFDIYELKSARKLTSSMLTLFTKVPQPKGANKTLLELFGYRARKKLSQISDTSSLSVDDQLNISEVGHPEVSITDKELHVTIDSNKVCDVFIIIIDIIYLAQVCMKNEKNHKDTFHLLLASHYVETKLWVRPITKK